jgi:hypothetical protein
VPELQHLDIGQLVPKSPPHRGDIAYRTAAAGAEFTVTLPAI